MRRSIDIIMNVGQANQSISFVNFARKECFLSIAWLQENERTKNGQNKSIERQTIDETKNVLKLRAFSFYIV